MSRSFTKLFSSITESTVWGECYATRIVWVSMLAMADHRGRVWAAVPGLARRAGVTLEEAEAALERFQQPDKYSRTADNEGRRIEVLDGGWQLLNYAKYREIRDDQTEAERNAERQRRYRERHNVSHGTVTESNESNAPLRSVTANNPIVEVEVEVEVEKEEKICPSPDGEGPTSGSKPIPYSAIVDAFNQAMLNLPKVRGLTTKRKTAIRTAWQESAERRSIEFWRAYFEECAADPFLNGAGPYKNGHENWRPDFDYLIRGGTVTKVYEKAMHRLERNRSAA